MEGAPGSDVPDRTLKLGPLICIGLWLLLDSCDRSFSVAPDFVIQGRDHGREEDEEDEYDDEEDNEEDHRMT